MCVGSDESSRRVHTSGRTDWIWRRLRRVCRGSRNVHIRTSPHSGRRCDRYRSSASVASERLVRPSAGVGYIGSDGRQNHGRGDGRGVGAVPTSQVLSSRWASASGHACGVCTSRRVPDKVSFTQTAVFATACNTMLTCWVHMTAMTTAHMWPWRECQHCSARRNLQPTLLTPLLQLTPGAQHW